MSIQETDFPCYYIDSNKASNKAQVTYKGITLGALILMFISTIIVSISPEVLSSLPNLEKANGIILFVSGSISLLLAFNKPERKWYLGRAIAESIKTLSWRYMMHADPFKCNDEKLDLDQFIDRMNSINKQANSDGFIPTPNKKHLEVITKKMSEVRSLNFLERKAYYAKNRIDDQINWYGKKSEANRTKASLCSFFIIIFQFGAAIYLFYFFDSVKFLNLNNIMIFLATSIIGILEMNKYKELHQSYALTKQELNLIRSKFGPIQENDEFNQFVLEAEQAISREHTMWLARRGNFN